MAPGRLVTAATNRVTVVPDEHARKKRGGSWRWSCPFLLLLLIMVKRAFGPTLTVMQSLMLLRMHAVRKLPPVDHHSCLY